MDTSGPATTNWCSDYGIRHLAIIPDGNRRWAQDRSQPARFGHEAGFRKLAELADRAFQRHVHTLTVWCFSAENWRRSSTETTDLMALCDDFVRSDVMPTAARFDARVHHLGRKERLPSDLRASLQLAEDTTAHHRSRTYNIAIDYSGQDELTRAGARLADALSASRAGEHKLVDFLDNAGQQYIEPDLVIRTSGEQRMSGFMPFQTAYSELFFVRELFPDLTFHHLEAIAEEFKQRRRSFGS